MLAGLMAHYLFAPRHARRKATAYPEMVELHNFANHILMKPDLLRLFETFLVLGHLGHQVSSTRKLETSDASDEAQALPLQPMLILKWHGKALSPGLKQQAFYLRKQAELSLAVQAWTHRVALGPTRLLLLCTPHLKGLVPRQKLNFSSSLCISQGLASRNTKPCQTLKRLKPELGSKGHVLLTIVWAPKTPEQDFCFALPKHFATWQETQY